MLGIRVPHERTCTILYANIKMLEPWKARFNVHSSYTIHPNAHMSDLKLYGFRSHTSGDLSTIANRVLNFFNSLKIEAGTVYTSVKSGIASDKYAS